MLIDVTNESEQAAILEQIVAAVFGTMTTLDVTRVDEKGFPNPGCLRATIRLNGSWKGAVTLETSFPCACSIAGHFLSMPAPDAIDDDVKDVMGEIANMIGGNLKSTLPPGATLSLPDVRIEQVDNSLPADAEVERHAFSTREGLFWVSKVSHG